MNDDHLRVYLNDHLAGAVGGIELAERCLGSNEGSELGAFLTRLLHEIKEDRGVLEDLLVRLGAAENPVKKAAAWAAEKLGRAKLNTNLVTYSDLSRLEELEALALGVLGKRALWASLDAAPRDERFEGIDFRWLMERARRQHDEIEGHRLRAAIRALASQPERA